MAFQPDGTVVEQFEIYDSGRLLHYDLAHAEDESGRLADALDQQAIESAINNFDGELIDETEYRRATTQLQPTNSQQSSSDG